MNIKRLLTATAIAVLPFAASAATLVVPASGTGPGANDSQWQTELTLHNTSSSAITATLRFHDRSGTTGTTTVNVAPRATVTIADIVKARFNFEQATGAIEIVVDDAFANRFTVASRTFNSSPAGEFGQDIPAISLSKPPSAGDVIILSAPSSTASARFNFGLYAIEASTIRWDLVRADGTIAATKEIDYAAGTQTQYNFGIPTLFGATSEDNDTVQAGVVKGSALAYGSAINNLSGDPTYVPGIQARTDLRINFLGVSFGDTGILSVRDANHDGILDAPINVYTGSIQTTFRVLVQSTTPATFELLTPNRDVQLFDTHGGVVWAPGGDTAGKSIDLKFRVTADGNTDVITIPVNIR